MPDWLEERAGTHGEAIAVVDRKGAVSWAELHERVDRMARLLAARGVGEGDRVACGFLPGLPWVELLHALPRLGAALVPLDPRLDAPAARRQAEAAGARLTVGEPLDGPEAGFEPVAPDPARAHTIVFTSGTTGRPRAVALTHANHEASARAVGERLGLGADDTWLSALPLFHVGGLAVLLRAAIHGSRVVIHPSWDESAVTSALEGGEITRVSLVPTQLGRLGRLYAPELRTVLLGGGAAAPDLLRLAAEGALPVVQTYGSTETASAVATRTAEEAVAGRGAEPLAGVELAIGDGGRVRVRGAMVAPEARDADGWLHTGDLGSLDGEGRLVVHGRAGDVIVTGGEKVAPERVEEALLAHPEVVDAGVAGRPDPEWGEAVTAWIVRGPVVVGDEELLAFLRARLAPHELPKRIHRVASLPRNAAGKLERRLL